MQAVTFKIMDIEGTVLRQGALSTDTEIVKQADDFKLCLYAEDGTLVWEQFLTGTDAVYEPRYFIYSQHCDKLGFYFGSYLDGYCNITAYKYGEDTPAATTALTGCSCQLPLEPGYYTIECTKASGENFFFQLRVYEENIAELGEKILSPFTEPDDWQLKAIESLQNYNSVMTDLYQLYMNGQSESAFKLLRSCIDIENARIAHANLHTGVTLDAQETSGLVFFNSDLDDIVVERYQSSNWLVCEHLKAVKQMQFKQNVLYRITGYINKGIVAQGYYCSPPSSLKAVLWEEETVLAENVANQKEVLVERQAAYGDFTIDEQTYAYIEETNSPSSPVTAKPYVYFAGGDLYVELIDGDLAAAIPNGLYAVVQETDLVISGGYKRRRLISGGSAVFDSIKDFIRTDEVYAVWIEDSRSQIVSLISFSDNSGISTDYNNKTRQQRIKETAASLMAYMKQKGSPDRETIRAMINYACSLTEIDSDNLHDYLLANCIENTQIEQLNRTMQTIKEHYSRERIDASFFGKVYYDQQLNRLVFPPLPSRPYSLRVTRLNRYQQSLTESYYLSGSGALEIDCGDSDYKFVQAIDQNTFDLSGFVFVCDIEKMKALNGWKIGVESLPWVNN